MAQRTITTRIALDGEAEFKKQLSSVNSELKTLKGEMSYTEAAFKGQANTMDALTEKERILREEIQLQEAKIKGLEQAVEDASEAYGDADKRTDSWRQSLLRAKTDLVKLNDELKDTDKYLEEAKGSSDKCATSIDGFGRAAKDSGDKTEGFGDKLKLLGMAGAAGVAVAGMKEIADVVLEIEESTREYRSIMGTLEVSSQQAGYTAEQTAEAYQRLYGVLGDAQTTATTVANLQAIGLSQEDLIALTDMATGAWAKYGDSIPIDGLAEAINETIQAGQVTGTFADVLNWAGESEDAFNEKLAAANTTAERAQIVMDQLANQGLADAGQAWRDVNEDIVAANEAQDRMEQAMGKLGEALAPVATAIKNFGADCIEWLADKIVAAVDAFNDFWEAMTKGDLNNERAARMAQQRGYDVDGSHAGGLDYVPYDGYVAQLHKGEAVLTAAENTTLQQLATNMSAQRGVTPQDLQAVTAAAVNGISTAMGGSGGSYRIEIPIVVNGQEFSRAIVPDLRAVMKSDPEVTDDK